MWMPLSILTYRCDSTKVVISKQAVIFRTLPSEPSLLYILCEGTTFPFYPFPSFHSASSYSTVLLFLFSFGIPLQHSQPLSVILSFSLSFSFYADRCLECDLKEYWEFWKRLEDEVREIEASASRWNSPYVGIESSGLTALFVRRHLLGFNAPLPLHYTPIDGFFICHYFP
jgi:hypothetical protein